VDSALGATGVGRSKRQRQHLKSFLEWTWVPSRNLGLDFDLARPGIKRGPYVRRQSLRSVGLNFMMIHGRSKRLKNLGELEQLVMDYVWASGPCTAEACREALAGVRPMKESTIRTVLRRIEEKSYVTHAVEGRTFIYRAAERRENVAVRAVKNIIDRFCGGSAEALVLGMVDNQVLDGKQLEILARKVALQKSRRRRDEK
jgi:BlaI family penicillinase repressor